MWGNVFPLVAAALDFLGRCKTLRGGERRNVPENEYHNLLARAEMLLLWDMYFERPSTRFLPRPHSDESRSCHLHCRSRVMWMRSAAD